MVDVALLIFWYKRLVSNLWKITPKVLYCYWTKYSTCYGESYTYKSSFCTRKRIYLHSGTFSIRQFSAWPHNLRSDSFGRLTLYRLPNRKTSCFCHRSKRRFLPYHGRSYLAKCTWGKCKSVWKLKITDIVYFLQHLIRIAIRIGPQIIFLHGNN